MFEKLKEDIQTVFDRDPAARTTFEVLTAYPGIHAVMIHRLSHWLWKNNLKWLARMTSHIGRWLTGIEIHPGAVLGKRFFIDHGMGVVIGETAVIGDNCTLYHGVTLGGTSWNKGKRHPTLGEGVVVGAGAKVLGPIEIGDNARIGSNAVVLRNIPAESTVVGIPGHIVSLVKSQPNPEREELARKIGFDAYGTTRDMPDPVATAINSMLDHINTMDKQMNLMCHEIKRLGGAIDDTPLQVIPDCALKDGENGVASQEGTPKTEADKPDKS